MAPTEPTDLGWNHLSWKRGQGSSATVVRLCLVSRDPESSPPNGIPFLSSSLRPVSPFHPVKSSFSDRFPPSPNTGWVLSRSE
ncbi:hypothetical protein IE53DRAFT_387580 [Violaceomyces palustris]|uniref:Uncharacterized protein n=1 Tax=Violaceomyces palustris TaxID=1673888 RepID=A0ACD0NWL7_9BASI|nr:hypothetical protein IE53DRAFT_387580 [Violaceomyces palustris]